MFTPIFDAHAAGGRWTDLRSDDPDDFVDEGRKYLQSDPKQALYYFLDALSIEPSHSIALRNAGLAYEMLGQHQIAFDVWDQYIEYYPNSHWGYEGKAMAMYDFEDYDSAVYYFDKSLSINYDSDIKLLRDLAQDQLERERGGCLIATATYGSEFAPQVQQLREIRDNQLLQTESGSSFMTGFNLFYYSFSSYIADYERENPVFKEFVKITITPLLTSLSLLNYVDMDSEAEVLGYGISLILLNIGMYFVAPIIVISKIRNRCR